MTEIIADVMTRDWPPSSAWRAGGRRPARWPQPRRPTWSVWPPNRLPHPHRGLRLCAHRRLRGRGQHL